MSTLEKMFISIKVNGVEYEEAVRGSETLLHVLREKVGLKSVKPGCENGDCGTCTVLFDGMPMMSCLTLAAEANGHEVTTVEDLQDTPIQQAFIDKMGYQCGYCTPGFLLTCKALLEAHPHADERLVEEWLSSNLCRCTSYQEIREAVQSVLVREDISEESYDGIDA